MWQGCFSWRCEKKLRAGLFLCSFYFVLKSHNFNDFPEFVSKFDLLTDARKNKHETMKQNRPALTFSSSTPKNHGAKTRSCKSTLFWYFGRGVLTRFCRLSPKKQKRRGRLLRVDATRSNAVQCRITPRINRCTAWTQTSMIFLFSYAINGQRGIPCI